MTESAAILVWLAEAFPDARLAPTPGDVGRAQFLRWMSYVSVAIYSLYNQGALNSPTITWGVKAMVSISRWSLMLCMPRIWV